MPKISLTGFAQLWFRVYRFDCDLNGHLTNSKYLAFMDLGRVSFIQQSGLLKAFYQRRWFPVLQSVDLTFIKEIRPYSKILLTTELLGCDEKYIYLQQKFLVNNQLCCVGRIRGVFVGPKGKVAMNDLLAVLPNQIPASPPSLESWKNYLVDKKNETTC
jgi:acyl-CoA thioesterase FadM